MTETLMNISNPYVGERRPGTVGFPLPGVSVQIRDGELLRQGPNVFAGYWRREDATRAAFVDGYFRTGDIAERSDDGYYTLKAAKRSHHLRRLQHLSPRDRGVPAGTGGGHRSRCSRNARPGSRRSPGGLRRVPARLRSSGARTPLPLRLRLLQSSTSVRPSRCAAANRPRQSPEASSARIDEIRRLPTPALLLDAEPSTRTSAAWPSSPRKRARSFALTRRRTNASRSRSGR